MVLVYFTKTCITLYKNRVNNSLHLRSEEISFVEEWISLDSTSRRVKFTTQRVESRPVHSIFTPKEVISDINTKGVTSVTSRVKIILFREYVSHRLSIYGTALPKGVPADIILTWGQHGNNDAVSLHHPKEPIHSTPKVTWEVERVHRSNQVKLRFSVGAMRGKEFIQRRTIRPTS